MLIFFLDSGSDCSFILNSALNKSHFCGKSDLGVVWQSNVTQSELRNLHEVNLSPSVHVQC